ncbi:heavy metal-binding domain-containing protein, partial [Candidatus Bipolaricaulota bacterium]|nr:heavy metal-binding domain-containing protein [Candidatus Bipolaricaulota bacterium]
MFLITTETIKGREINEVLGLVRGNTIRARHMGRDIMAGLRNIVGGEIKEYTRMLSQARNQAVER